MFPFQKKTQEELDKQDEQLTEQWQEEQKKEKERMREQEEKEQSVVQILVLDEVDTDTYRRKHRETLPAFFQSTSHILREKGGWTPTFIPNLLLGRRIVPVDDLRLEIDGIPCYILILKWDQQCARGIAESRNYLRDADVVLLNTLDADSTQLEIAKLIQESCKKIGNVFSVMTTDMAIGKKIEQKGFPVLLAVDTSKSEIKSQTEPLARKLLSEFMQALHVADLPAELNKLVVEYSDIVNDLSSIILSIVKNTYLSARENLLRGAIQKLAVTHKESGWITTDTGAVTKYQEPRTTKIYATYGEIFDSVVQITLSFKTDLPQEVQDIIGEYFGKSPGKKSQAISAIPRVVLEPYVFAVNFYNKLKTELEPFTKKFPEESKESKIIKSVLEEAKNFALLASGKDPLMSQEALIRDLSRASKKFDTLFHTNAVAKVLNANIQTLKEFTVKDEYYKKILPSYKKLLESKHTPENASDPKPKP